MNKKIVILSLLIIIIAIISFIFFDKTIAYFFHNHIKNNSKHIINFITNLGKSEYYLIPSLILYILYKKKNEVIKKGSLLLFWSVALSGIIVDVIKIIVARYRPPTLFENNLYGFKGFDIGFLVNSFPSGHSATAFSAFISLMFIFPKYKYIFIIIAILIAFSRVLLSVHYLSDILIGSLIGYLTTYILYLKIFKDENENKL